MNCVHRWMPELIQEVIELTGNLCFLFCSTPRIMLIVKELAIMILVNVTVIGPVVVVVMMMIKDMKIFSF